MNNDKMIQFVKRWREIERQQRDLDFARSQLARDIRAEFSKGEAGDRQFINWCADELGLNGFAAKELLLRAVAVTVVPDERTWKMVGGFKAIRPMQDLTRPQQVAVLEAAKAQSRAPRSIMKERGLIPPPPPPPPLVSRPPRPANSGDQDAEFFAQYIATLKNVPREVMSRVGRYVGSKSRFLKAA